MKVFIIVAAAILTASALPAQEHWTLFKAKHGKSYGSIAEEKLRFQIFQDNVKKVNEHNALYDAGLKTYTMAVNKFADLTTKEFGDMLRRQNGPAPKKNFRRHVQVGSAPDSIDWREKNAVLDVKDQGHCGSCWAFSVTGTIEGQNALKNNQRIPLSEQQLVDCDTEWNNGCIGGDTTVAIEYVIENGINSEAEYPYEETKLSCRAKTGSIVNVTEGVNVDPYESDLRDAVGTVGPVAVSMYADLLQLYEGGIFDNADCINRGDSLDHAVLAVGYGTENGKKYWIIKNSWGTSWGENGYFKLVRDASQCGIALDPIYPILA